MQGLTLKVLMFLVVRIMYQLALIGLQGLPFGRPDPVLNSKADCCCPSLTDNYATHLQLIIALDIINFPKEILS